MSLKRRPNVVFVGIDTLDDIRNNSYNELFASGGCVVSDELALSPEFVTPGRSGAAAPSVALAASSCLFLMTLMCFCSPTNCPAGAAGAVQFSRECVEAKSSLQNPQDIKRSFQVLILHLHHDVCVFTFL